MALEALVLHLGAHKTGTSLIQKYIRDNAEICARAGVCGILRAETDRTIGWGRPADIAAGTEDLRAHIDEAIAQGGRYFVLSHENALGRPFDAERGSKKMYPFAPKRGRALRDALEGYPIKVVYYIRSAAEFMESYYLQTIHEGGHTPFRAWRRKIGNPSLSWQPLYDDLCELFSAENIVLKSFDQEIAAGQAAFLEGFFASFMDPPPDPADFDGFDYAAFRNPSIGERGLELALAVNPLLQSGTERKLMRKFLQTHFSNQTHPRALLLNGKDKNQISETMKDDVAEVMAEHEARIGGAEATKATEAFVSPAVPNITTEQDTPAA